MTDHLVRKYTDYPSLEHYLKGYAIVGDAPGTSSPVTSDARSTIRSSRRRPDRLPSRPLEVTRTRFGGHSGYYDGRPGPSWRERLPSSRRNRPTRETPAGGAGARSRVRLIVTDGGWRSVW
jgi:hypothetical protein